MPVLGDDLIHSTQAIADSSKRSSWDLRRASRVLAAAAVLIGGFALVGWILSKTDSAGKRDFISYWAAGQLLRQHANPYDAEAVFRLEKAAGWTGDKPLVMRNPPFALALAIPLGWFSPTSGAVLWSMLMVAALMISVRILWIMHGRPPDRLHLLAYVFAPALSCMQLGQTSAFVLLGLVLFLHLHSRRPFLTGLAFPLFFLKPHLLLAFGLVLLIWVVYTRSHVILLGAVSATAVLLAIALWFDPRVFSHYLPVLHTAESEIGWIPTLSTMLRLLLFRNAAWSQWLPAICICAWSLLYYRRHSEEWSWSRHGLLLLMASVWSAPYYWFTDETVLVPAVLRAVYLNAERTWRLMAFAAIDAVPLLMIGFNLQLNEGWYIWTSSAWLAWYLWATR